MIVRIMGEGQFVVADDQVEALNPLDRAVERAVQDDDEAAFGPAMSALLGAVRQHGTPVPEDELIDSGLILPPADASVAEVSEMLGDDGLIPG